MSNKKKLTQIVSWILIVILMMPNIAFAEEPTNLEYITTEPTTDVSAENQLNNLTVNANLSSTFDVRLTDPSKSYYIKDFSFDSLAGGMGFRIDDGILTVRTINDGRYSFTLSSNEADTFGFSKPFVFDVVNGLAYKVEDSDNSPITTLPINPLNLITGPIEITLTEGILIGYAYDQYGLINTETGILRVFNLNDFGEYEFLTFMEINKDGSIVLPNTNGTYKLDYNLYGNLYPETIAFPDEIEVIINESSIIGSRDMKLSPVQLEVKLTRFDGTEVPFIPDTVKIFDMNNTMVNYDVLHYNDNGVIKHGYGRIPAGNYKILAIPGMDEELLGSSSTDAINFTIYDDGFANFDNSVLDINLRYNKRLIEPEETTVILNANFLDPTGTYAIKDYYVQSINGYQTGEINFDIIDGVFTIRSAANGRYGFYFTSNEADIYGYSKPIIFDVVDGEAYSVSEDDVSTTPAIPVNPDLKINDPLNVLARAGVLIGRAYDHHGVIRPEVGHISVEKRGEDGYYQFVTDMAINVDGTVALPKEDGEYIVILWPFPDRITDAKTVQDVLNVSISEGVVTGARDLKLSPIQLAGMMLDPEGNPLAYDDFWVQIQDAKGNHLMGAQSYYTENGLRYFEVGHLTEGHYRIVGYPNYADAEHGIYTSEPINFYVNALGVATSSAVTDLKNISLRLRSSVNAPLNLKENITNYTLLRDNAIKVEVKLENVLTRNADDIKVELLIGDDTQGIELQNPVYKSLWPEYENVSGFYAKFDLSDIRLNLSDQYKIRLTDLTKPFGSQSVEFPLVVTTNPMIEYAVSVGNDGDLNYQLVFGSLEQSKVYTVRIFDNSDIQVGAGTIEYDAKYKNMILKSQLQPDSQPTYFRLDDASILFMNTMSDDFNRQAQPYNALWSVEEVCENYVVKIHNESINMVDFKNFEIVKWNEVGRDVVMQSSGNTAVNVETFDDFVDGLKVTFPKTLIDSNQFYGTLVTFGENMIGYGDLFFPNESEALVIATLYDPTGNTQINEVEMWESYRSDGSEYTLSVDHGKAYFDTDTDGEYHFVLYSKGNDDYAYSKAVKIRVIDGKAYYAETPETVMPHDIQVKLQEGIKLGTIYDEYGNPSSNQGYLGINHIDAVGNWTWLGCFMAKSDGSIYVPKADGDYMIFYETWADMTEYIGDEKMYTISSGIITNPFDFYASIVQFSGEIFTDINKPAVYRDFNVGIFDSNDQFVKYARISNSEGKFTYKVGGLPEGDYSYRLEIYDYYVVRGFTNGLPVPFSILGLMHIPLTQDLAG